MDLHELGTILRHVSRTHRKLSWVYYRECGFSTGQPPILRYLHENDGCIQSDLSRFFHLEPATITSNLTNMERDGLVERRPNPTDRRVWRVFLTEKGQQAYEKLQKNDEIIARQCFEGFSEDEEALAKEILLRLQSNMRQVLDGSTNTNSRESQGGKKESC